MHGFSKFTHGRRRFLALSLGLCCLWTSSYLPAQDPEAKIAVSNSQSLDEEIDLTEIELEIRKQEVVIGKLQLLDDLEHGKKQHEIQVDEANSLLKFIEQDLNRVEELFKQGVQSQQKLMELQAKRDETVARLRLSEASLEAISKKKRLATEQIRLLELRVKAVEVKLKHLRLRRDRIQRIIPKRATD